MCGLTSKSLASAFFVAAGAVALIAIAPDGAARADGSAVQGNRAPSSENAPAQSAVADWLERVARTYQDEIAAKLSTSKQPGSVAEPIADERASLSAAEALKRSVAASVDYVAFWISQAAYVVTGDPATRLAFGIADPAAERAARSADAFVEARNRADVEWKAAVAQADAAADAARKDPGAAATTGDTPAEAELKRAEARKQELERIKRDLDRRIEEGLKKLEQFEKKEQQRRSDMQAFLPVRKPAAQTAADPDRAKIEAGETAKRNWEAEQASLAAERQAQIQAQAEREKTRLADEQAAAERRAAEAAARAAEEARIAEQKRAEDERQRVAEAKAEADRQAQADAERLRDAEEARRANEQKQAEAERQKIAAAEELAERRASEEKRQAADDARLAKEQAAARDAERIAAAPAQPEQRDVAKAKKVSERPVRLAEERAQSRKPAGSLIKWTRAKTAKPRKNRQHVAQNQCRKKPGKARSRNVHVVQRGETLWKISQRHLRKGERFSAIRTANGRKIRDPHRIYPCQRLLLPERA